MFPGPDTNPADQGRQGMASEPPVLPDGEEARRWAAEELAKPGYPRPGPAWLEDIREGFLEWLGQLGGPSGPPPSVAGPLIATAAVVIIVAAIIMVKPRLNARRKAHKAMYDAATVVSAAGYRERADQAAAAGDMAGAVVNRYRAVVRAAEEDEIIDVRPGRTADEAARQLGQAYPRHSSRLTTAAGTFDAILYGHSDADQEDYAAMSALDNTLQKESRPADSTASPALQEMQAPR